MNYEKKYKEALENARQEYNTTENVERKQWLEELFPELAESEDERISREITEFIVNFYNGNYEKPYDYTIGTWVAWLEMQGKSLKIKKGKNYLCTKTHKYAGVEWIKGTKYYASDNYTLVNQGCEYYCPEYSKEEHINLFEEVKYDGWLEKQGEQKHNPCDGCINRKGCINCENGELRETEKKTADNVEPKFNVGDWLQYRNAKPFLVEEITKQGYVNGDSCLPFNWENEIHLWTAQDAKDGDVLVYNNSSVEIILLFKRWMNGIGEGAYSYAHTFNNKILFNDWSDCGYATHPATKEQRVLLFQKIKEAGYEWDAEKKELNEIEHTPAWGEEDEHRVKDTIYFLDTAKKHYASTVELDACIDWVKSLKQRWRNEL